MRRLLSLHHYHHYHPPPPPPPPLLHHHHFLLDFSTSSSSSPSSSFFQMLTSVLQDTWTVMSMPCVQTLKDRTIAFVRMGIMETDATARVKCNGVLN